MSHGDNIEKLYIHLSGAEWKLAVAKELLDAYLGMRIVELVSSESIAKNLAEVKVRQETEYKEKMTNVINAKREAVIAKGKIKAEEMRWEEERTKLSYQKTLIERGLCNEFDPKCLT